ncbi:MAG TPA: hypothetical protein VLW53_18155, partial [Candidatus Eisenbacteria bacterium]|nr:hypothetical protein [Candidatus Eisenbacteria bacterium]
VRGPGGDDDARRARARLEGEGVAFRGRAADPARRVGWIELRGRLGELGELDESSLPLEGGGSGWG